MSRVRFGFPGLIREVEFRFVQDPALGATQGRGSHQRNAVVHLVLESRSNRPERPGFFRFLRRWNR